MKHMASKLTAATIVLAVASACSGSSASFNGSYILPEDGSTLKISENENGKPSIDIELFRLASLDDGTGSFSGDKLDFSATDASGEPIYGSVKLKGDTAVVTFSKSTWEYLPSGTTYRFVRQK